MIPVVYIGYDPGEQDAFDVCKFSIEKRTFGVCVVKKLDLSILKHIRAYSRKYRIEQGQMIDSLDGKPFSTEFSFSRFLVPSLNLFEGWALFCDPDFLFLDDIEKLFRLRDDRFAAMVVKHKHDPKEETKMDGRVQTRYFRKNWSSLVLWNCGHPANRILTPRVVSQRTGQWLHAFQWLKDSEIGELPLSWNWLSGVSKPLDGNKVPHAVHFTLGGPWFENHKHHPYADRWVGEFAAFEATQRVRQRAA